MSVVQAEGSRCDIISAVITKTESEEAANVSLQRREEREERLKTPGGGVKRRRGGGEETSPQSENEMCARSRRAFSVYTGLKLLSVWGLGGSKLHPGGTSLVDSGTLKTANIKEGFFFFQDIKLNCISK